MSVFKSIGFKRSQDLTSFLLEEGDKSNLEQKSYFTKLFSPFPVFLLSRKGVSSRQKFFFPFLLHLFCLFVLLDFFFFFAQATVDITMVRDGDAAEMARDWEIYLLFSCQKTKNSICNRGEISC